MNQCRGEIRLGHEDKKPASMSLQRVDISRLYNVLCIKSMQFAIVMYGLVHKVDGTRFGLSLYTVWLMYA